MSERTAHHIASELLEKTGNAMRDGDFDAFMHHFALPFVMETFDGKHLMQTRAELERVFDAVRGFHAENNVTDIVRESIAAEFVDHRTIASTHVAQMLTKDNILFGRPYPAYSLIRRIGDIWRIQFCQYAVEEPHRLNEVLGVEKEKAPRVTTAPNSSREKRVRTPDLRTSF